jgi:hypothetical protein
LLVVIVQAGAKMSGSPGIAVKPPICSGASQGLRCHLPHGEAECPSSPDQAVGPFTAIPGDPDVGRWVTGPGGVDGGGEERKDVASLLAAGHHDGQHALDEATAGGAACPETALAPQDRRTEGLFGGVVGRRHVLHAEEAAPHTISAVPSVPYMLPPMPVRLPRTPLPTRAAISVRNEGALRLLLWCRPNADDSTVLT